ncbi:MAG: TcpQ domain-containing protein [Bdellovibrionales bacterium]
MTSSISKTLILSFLLCGAGTAHAGFDFNSTGTQAPVYKGKSAPAIAPIAILEEKDTKPILKVYEKGKKQEVDEVLPPVSDVIDYSFKHTNVQTWKADSGESLRQVINRWSKRAGVDLVWSIQEKRSVIESISYFGDFENALMHLFDEGMNGTVEGELAYTQVQKPEEFNLPPQTVKPASVASKPLQKATPSSHDRKWKAQRNESLEGVLSRWQGAGQYELIWDYPYEANVGNNFFAYGSIEDAVSLLLNEYPQSETRPVGDMYKDPETSKTYLHIRKEK